MDWAALALLLLKAANWFLDRDQNQRDAGVDAEVARAATAVAAKTRFAKQAMEEISALPSDKVDDLLRRLEP